MGYNEIFQGLALSLTYDYMSVSITVSGSTIEYGPLLPYKEAAPSLPPLPSHREYQGECPWGGLPQHLHGLRTPLGHSNCKKRGEGKWKAERGTVTRQMGGKSS